jgi:hypothetical protein
MAQTATNNRMKTPPPTLLPQGKIRVLGVLPEPKLENTGPPGDHSWIPLHKRKTIRPAGSMPTHPGDEKNWL